MVHDIAYHQLTVYHQAKTEPLRLQQTIPTFPYFQLSRLSSLMSDLGLTPSTYLDTYNSQSGRWEQHTIGSVRLVETQQRLLYRIRQSLFEGLPEDDCLSLGEEVELQAKPTRGGVVAAAPRAHDEGMGTLKRSAPDMPDPGPAAKRQATNGYYMNASPAVFGASAPSTQPDGPPPAPQIESQNGSSTSNNNSVAAAAAAAAAAAYLYQSTLSFTPHSASPHLLPPYLTNPNHGSTPIPYHPHPPLKRWPNDYTVSELSAGFLAMEALISQSPTGASMTQRAAFERVFGSRYVKSTVCRHRGVWRKAHPGVREQFEKMGGDERACWGEFVRRVEGRPVAGKLGPGLAQQQQPIAYHGPPGAAMVAHPGHGTDSQNAPEGGSEPAMGSLQDPATQGLQLTVYGAPPPR